MMSFRRTIFYFNNFLSKSKSLVHISLTEDVATRPFLEFLFHYDKILAASPIINFNCRIDS